MHADISVCCYVYANVSVHTSYTCIPFYMPVYIYVHTVYIYVHTYIYVDRKRYVYMEANKLHAI